MSFKFMYNFNSNNKSYIFYKLRKKHKTKKKLTYILNEMQDSNKLTNTKRCGGY